MLAGLIIAVADAEGETTLCAELPIAGHSVIEHQARLLASVGVDHLVILVERLPAQLLAAIDRLKRDGLTVDIARGVNDAADRIQPHERFILVADSLIADRAVLERVSARTETVVLTLPDTPDNAGWERIDAQARWAGLAIMDGSLLHRTAGMLGDWSLQSTLLRQAVQNGAAYVDADAGAGGTFLAIVDSRATAVTVDAELGRRATHDYTGIPDQYLFSPLAHLAGQRAMQAMIPPLWFRIGAVALTGLAAITFGMGWIWPGIIALLLAGPVDSLGRQIAALGWRPERERRRWDVIRLLTTAAALLIFGWHMAADGRGWEYVAIALAIIAGMGAIANHQRLFGKPMPRPIWLAEIDSLIWLYLPFALAGAYRLGLAVLAILIFLSLLETQRRTAGQD